MLGLQLPVRRARKDEAEKPFWISFSDLMTALMVLFLVTMTVALLNITQKVSDADRQREEERRVRQQRIDEIEQLLVQIKESAEDYPGVVVRGHSVDFGDKARFDFAKHQLTPDQSQLLRVFVPKILEKVRSPLGQKWFKRVVVEGFADQSGTYIRNLNLSLQRSERVLCVLLASPEAVKDALSDEDRLMVQELFLVGGSSFNFLKESDEESRRIELKLEFLEMGEQRPAVRKSPLDSVTRCPLDA